MSTLQRFLVITLLVNCYFISGMQLGVRRHLLLSYSTGCHTITRSLHNTSANNTTAIKEILKPLKTDSEKRIFYNLIINKSNAQARAKTKINKKIKFITYLMPYQSLDNHLETIFRLQSIKKKNLAIAYQKFFHLLSNQIDAYKEIYKTKTGKEPTEAVNQLCLSAATEQIVRLFQQELEPELKIINVTL